MFGSKEAFLLRFNPDKQHTMAAHFELCVSRDFPTLGQLSKDLGKDTSEAWLEMQINDLSEYAGTKDKLTPYQVQDVARTIFANFGHMKFTELMVFFSRFKGGHYGRFYGTVDGLIITEAIHKFFKERNRVLDIIEEREERERFEEERKRIRERGITYNEYLQLKEKNDEILRSNSESNQD